MNQLMGKEVWMSWIHRFKLAQMKTSGSVGSDPWGSKIQIISRLATISEKGTIQFKFMESIQDIEYKKNYRKGNTNFMYYGNQLDNYYKKKTKKIILSFLTRKGEFSQKL